jgi:hypothetical protein
MDARRNLRTIIIFIGFSFLLFFLGYNLGIFVTIKGALKIVPLFIDGININYQMIERAIFSYKNQIGGCVQEVFSNETLQNLINQSIL